MSLKLIGTTYSMAQSVAWIDQDTFAIGRWDGTLTLFALPSEPEGGPRIESAAISPVATGVQMVARVDERRFVTSNDASSLLLYLTASGMETVPQRVDYDASHGIANSGTSFSLDGHRWLVTGHETGALLIWSVTDRAVVLELAIDLCSPDPIQSELGLRNVRAVARWREGIVVTGSEDGDLCVVRIPSGEVIERRRYNPDAKRGINDVSVSGDIVMVANCSVGRDDKNCWTFAFQGSGQLEPIASTNLVVDTAREQVFNFAVELVSEGNSTFFACATGEGLLWVGEVNTDSIAVGAPVPVSSGLGAAITYGSHAGVLAVVGDNVHLYELVSEDDGD